MEGQVNGGSAKVVAEAFAERMQQRIDQTMQEVVEAVNSAPDGAWINASEMKVRDVFAELRREAYETALQMRLDATQAAFSPGGQGQRAAAAEQRP
jgi:cytidylate kinase